MSGICGVLALDGCDASLGPILAKLEQRGPDGSHCWADGHVTLGHALLATTPEALVEILPLNDATSGCSITADVRLDNRAELFEALEIADEGRTIGDGELIIRAYNKWGEQCPDHLLGDFAFAIWDPRRKRLLCARDQMGMRQLIYHHAPGRLFAFATETEALMAHVAIEKVVEQGRIADFLLNLEGADLTSTFFEKVFRLPAAHYLTFSNGELSVRRYWQLRAPIQLGPMSNDEYAAGFRKVFEEAVRCRMRSPSPVAAMLSGGLDSSSVAAVASDQLKQSNSGPLATFSAASPDGESCPETEAIQQALKTESFQPTLLRRDKIEFIREELEQQTKSMAEPFDGHMTLLRAIYIASHRCGYKVVLDGAAGDVVLGAANRIATSLRRFAFTAAVRQARGEEVFWKIPGYARRALIQGAWVAFVPRTVRVIRRKIIDMAEDRQSKRRLFASLLSANLNIGIDRQRRFRHHRVPSGLTEVEHRIRSITHPHLVVGRERYDRVAAANAIEPRDPFLDLRVINFCLSLPADQLEQDGWPKVVLRRAMSGLLPQSVAWRRGKEHLGWAFTQEFMGDRNEPIDEVSRLINCPHHASNWSSLDPVQRLDSKFLALWLSANDTPSVPDLVSELSGLPELAV